MVCNQGSLICNYSWSQNPWRSSRHINRGSKAASFRVSQESSLSEISQTSSGNEGDGFVDWQVWSLITELGSSTSSSGWHRTWSHFSCEWLNSGLTLLNLEADQRYEWHIVLVEIPPWHTNLVVSLDPSIYRLRVLYIRHDLSGPGMSVAAPVIPPLIFRGTLMQISHRTESLFTYLCFLSSYHAF